MADVAHTQVLIAGAGPTGLMLAAQLARHGADFLIVDGKSGPTRESRALGVQARTLELYEALGIAAAAVEQGRPTLAVNLYVGERRVQRIPLAEIGRGQSPYPFLLILEQSRNEALLYGALRDAGCDVAWNTSLGGFRDEGEHISATLRHADGREETLTADWLVGCDGARSTVREQLGLTFAGGTYENAFYVADVRAEGPLMQGELMVCLSRETFVLFFPMPGEQRYRVIGVLPRDGRLDDPTLTFDDIEAAVRAQLDIDVRFSDVAWFSAYRVHHRCVQRFRTGRVFVAGDAAHVHSPVGAQGMNTGLQDACNLAWKLALVASGQAGAALLDSYHAERWPFAQRLLATTDTAFRVAVSPRPLPRMFRLRVFPWLASRLMQRSSVRGFIFRTVSQTGIHYRRSPLSRSGAKVRAPRASSNARAWGQHRNAASPRHSATRLTVQAGDRLPFAEVGPPLALHRESVYAWLRAPGLHLLMLQRDPEGLRALAAEWRERLAASFAPVVTVRAVSAQADTAGLFDALGVNDRALLLVRPDQYLAYVDVSFDWPALQAFLSGTLGLQVSRRGRS
jgi:2-polyprenyl-6-methoxyphenol hydroxylase-like FAD-dependent oxidoreductase